MILLAAAATGCAQYQIKSWTTDDGLPQNTVRSMAQTPDGYLWMTTLDGLVRFDGVRFTVFSKNNIAGFGANRLNQIVQSLDGDLWIGAETDFVLRYHAGAFSTFALDAAGSEITNLILDEASVPVVYSDAGVFRWNGADFALSAPTAGETKESQVLWSKAGAFWYSNENTLHRLQNGVLTDFQLPGNKDGSFVKLFENSRGRLWCGTRNNGLAVIENRRLKNYTLADGLLHPTIQFLSLKDRLAVFRVITVSRRLLPDRPFF